MKLFFTCMECFREAGKPSEEYVPLELRDDGLYEFKCSRGHRAITAVQQQKFEVLFELGTHALLDGYYREAVSGFSASLERFYEFCLKVFCERSSIQATEWEKSWKQVAAQSERQFGAFVFMRLAVLEKAPQVLSPKWREFRNDVIHKGYLPTREKTIEYGNTIRSLIEEEIDCLRERFQEGNTQGHRPTSSFMSVASSCEHPDRNDVHRHDCLSYEGKQPHDTRRFTRAH